MSERKIEPLIDTLNAGTREGFAIYYEGRMNVKRLDRMLGILVVIRNDFADDERRQVEAAIPLPIDSRALNGETR